MSTFILAAVAVSAVVALIITVHLLRKARAEHEAVKSERDSLSHSIAALKERFKGVADVEAERQRVLGGLAARRTVIEAEIGAYEKRREESAAMAEAVEAKLSVLRSELNALEEKADLIEVGYYEPHFDFDTSERYKREIERVREAQKHMLKEKRAAISRIEWQVAGDRKAGKRMTDQALRLMLRAFNGECDAAIANVRFNNVNTMEARIRKAFEAINNLNSVNRCELAPSYLSLKLEELFLAHEYQEKLYQEREEQRRIREQIREEERAQREFEQAQREAEREEQRYADALTKARQEVEAAEGAKRERLLSKIAELERRVQEAHALKERAIARAQLTRSGHVYVISNIGSFGEHVFKIGMTRRLDPQDRIRELGDASVPFHFDVHAIIYSEDAPALEARLHRAFARRRVNRINERKEFFRVTLEDIERVVQESHADIEFTKIAEAADYRKTLAQLRHEHSDDELLQDSAYSAPSLLERLRREMIAGSKSEAEGKRAPTPDSMTPTSSQAITST